MGVLAVNNRSRLTRATRATNNTAPRPPAAVHRKRPVSNAGVPNQKTNAITAVLKRSRGFAPGSKTTPLTANGSACCERARYKISAQCCLMHPPQRRKGLFYRLQPTALQNLLRLRYKISSSINPLFLLD